MNWHGGWVTVGYTALVLGWLFVILGWAYVFEEDDAGPGPFCTVLVLTFLVVFFTVAVVT